MSNSPIFSQLQSMRNNGKFYRYQILVLLPILVITVVVRIPTLLEPWGSDQGVFGYIASEMLDGKVPYKDMYTSSGYGLYFVYALFFKLFGNQMISLHIGDLVASLITVILVFGLTQLLYGRECAIFAAIAVAFFGSGRAFSYLYEMKGAWGTYWQLAQRETFMVPLITAGILLSILADRRKKWHLYFWVGIVIGLATIFKITAVVILGILIAYIVLSEFFNREGDGFRRPLYKGSILILGAIAAQIPFLYYFWIHDSLYTMYKAVFVHTSVYAKLSRGHILANAFTGNTYIPSENLVLWLFSFVSIIYLMIHARKRENYLIVAWTLGTLLMVWGQGKFFGYHYLLIIAPFSVLTGFGIKRFLKIKPSWKDSFLSARKNIVQIFLWIIILANVMAFVVNNYDHYHWHFLYLSGKISKDEYYEVFNEYPLHLYSFRADYDVVKYLKKYAQPGDSLRTINGGGDTIIHYLSGVHSPTRFTSTWYLFNKALYDNPLTAELRKELIKGVHEEKPDYILLIYSTLEELSKEFNQDKYQDVMTLIDYLQNNYVLEKSFRDKRILYKRI